MAKDIKSETKTKERNRMRKKDVKQCAATRPMLFRALSMWLDQGQLVHVEMSISRI